MGRYRLGKLSRAAVLALLGFVLNQGALAADNMTCDGVVFGSHFLSDPFIKKVVAQLNARLLAKGIGPDEMHFTADASAPSTEIGSRDLSTYDWRKLIEGVAVELRGRQDTYLDLQRDAEPYLDHRSFRTSMSRLNLERFRYSLGYLRSKGLGAIALRRVSLIPTAAASANGSTTTTGVRVRMTPSILILPRDIRDVDSYLKTGELVLVDANRRSSSQVKDNRTGIVMLAMDDIVGKADAFFPNQAYSAQLIDEADAYSRREVEEIINRVEGASEQGSKNSGASDYLH